MWILIAVITMFGVYSDVKKHEATSEIRPHIVNRAADHTFVPVQVEK